MFQRDFLTGYFFSRFDSECDKSDRGFNFHILSNCFLGEFEFFFRIHEKIISLIPRRSKATAIIVPHIFYFAKSNLCHRTDDDLHDAIATQERHLLVGKIEECRGILIIVSAKIAVTDAKPVCGHETALMQ